jgi:tetratricopeptide (TPR) repeat protein
MSEEQNPDHEYLLNETMNDNSLLEEEALFEENSLDDETSLSDDSTRGGIALLWRMLALGAALVIIAGLAYPFLQQQFQSSSTLPTATVVSIEQETHTPTEWFDLGKDFYKQNQWTQAATAFEKAIELDPTYQAAYANLGAAYHRQNRLDLAVTQYEKALEIDPEDGEVVYNLAAVYIKQAAQAGLPDPALLNQAIEQLNRALELSPTSAEPYFGLGVAYAALNQPQEAINAFEVFLERDSGDDPRAREEAERHLEFLRGQP